ncbi:MAG: sigma-54-dependent Fis family transcriptional regulator [Deltaproteobacteria bacterium]|nr:sigma-54-dependent Fis family transcriptional regulator [Deltaproteobacteria bacterium]
MEGYILIADDEKTFRDTLAKVLIEEGYEVMTAPNGVVALQEISKQEFDVAFCDIRMPGIDGLQLLEEIRKVSPRTSVIIITAYGSIESAVQALKRGAYDYIVKPLIFDEVLVKVKNIIGFQELSRDYKRLRAEVEERYDFRNIVGISPKICEVLNLVKKITSTKSTVLITGESGTGKELIARAIHQNSPRKTEKFVPINCAAIPDNLLESELFGHVKGAFTGAISSKEGLFKIADKGTLFLDEVGELPLSLQVKLLRVIEDGEVLPLGGVKTIKTDIRLIAATTRNLSKEVEKGNFREELYYRLNVVEIALPPLRERKEDIPPLVNHFVNRLNMELRKSVSGVDPQAMRILLSYSWKGNVRELRNVIERAMILCEGDIIMPFDLPSPLSVGKEPIEKEEDNLKEILRKYEREHIIKVLEKTGPDKKEAARLLGLSLSSLYRKIEELSIPWI